MSSPPVELDKAPKLPARRRRIGRRRLIAVLGIAFAVPAIVLAAAQRRTDAAPPAVDEPTDPDPAATTVLVRRQDLTGKLQLAARSVAVNAVVSPPSDRSAEALVADGTRVAAGDPVLQVAPDQSSLDEARGAVTNATDELGRARDAHESGAMLAEQAASSARTALQRAQDDLDTIKRSSPPPDQATVTAANRAVEDAQTALDDALDNNDVSAEALQRDVDDAQAALDDAQRRLTELEADTATLVAPANGNVRFDQAMNATITGDFVVVADVLPLQQLRLSSGSISATAQIEGVNGPQDFECQTVTIVGAATSAPAGAGNTPADGTATATAPDGSGAVQCTSDESIPPIAGLQAQLRVEIQLATDALVVPDVAIAYVDGTPTVTLTDGTSVPVEVGPTDGVLRVVEGVDDGAEVIVP